jgi:3-oxoadipate enol-lactonase
MKTKIAGAELNYDVSGAGPAVLFLHAFPLDLRMWDAQAAALAPTRTVVRFDCRGFGGSAPADAALSMERIADDGAALLDTLGISQATVAGCSMGGYAAFAMVRRHADRIRALVLEDTRAVADSAEARTTRALQAETILKQGAAAAVEAFLPKLLGKTTHAERPHVVAWVRETILAASPRGIADALAGLASRADSTPTLREVRVPTLILCGSEDVITPPADSQAMQRAIPGSRLEVIPRAGHLANLEDPAAFGAALSGFLASLG